jgi:two-component sensor histidine kinase
MSELLIASEEGCLCRGEREKGDMTKHVVHSADPDGSLLVRELPHRINNELTCAICAVSVRAMESKEVAVKAALLDVVELLHDYADVHKALHMPQPGRFTDAARYLQRLCFSITKYRLDRLGIRVLYSADELRLEGERCWKLGLILSELLTNVARHAQFGDRQPEAQVKLALAGGVVRCVVSDNGSTSELILRGRGLTIVGELAGSLGGRVHTACAAEGSSLLLTFPLTEAEQRAAGATRVGWKRRKARQPSEIAGL